MSESFAEMFEETRIDAKMRPGSIVTGTVVDVYQDNVIVNAGLKSEAWIPIAQFYDEQGELEVGIGDEVDVALDAVEDGFGETRLSREKAKRQRAWEKLEQASQTNETITGMITEKVKGGFTVDVEHVRAFLPGSLVDTRPVKDATYLEGKKLEFKVIKIDRRRSNVVLSRRAVVETESSAERAALLENLKEGMTVTGLVKNLTDYGAFLDLGGIDGLLHITDMAWRRVKNPSEIVAIGQEIEVKVLKFDRERNRVSLGLKQTGEDPWRNLGDRFPTGEKLRGRVTNLADYGCFVELEEGVEGLVHVSEMDWTNKNAHPSKLAHVGDEVEVVILDIDQERRRISLGMKQCMPNPWEAFSATRKRGERVSGRIKSITDFGIFIGLEGGIDGLVHLSDVSWTEDGEEALRNFKKGDQIEAVMLTVDTERERISLGLKQLQKDPFAAYVSEHPKGSVVKGEVKEVEQRLATLRLAAGVNATLKASELSNEEKVDDARRFLKAGQELEVKIVSADRKRRAIAVSLRARQADEESAAAEDYAPDADSGAKLGDVLKDRRDEEA